jgi:predicted MFS family arabinose efflux permease
VYGFATVACLAAGALLLAVFTAIQIRAAHPLLPLRVVLDRNRGGSYLALGIVGLGTFGVFLFMTYYLQQTKGYSPSRTGVSFLPFSAAVVFAAAIANARAKPTLNRPAPAKRTDTSTKEPLMSKNNAQRSMGCCGTPHLT